jgi:hypothetical protein
MVTHFCNHGKQNVNWRRARKCHEFAPLKDWKPRSCNQCQNASKLEINPYDCAEAV